MQVRTSMSTSAMSTSPMSTSVSLKKSGPVLAACALAAAALVVLFLTASTPEVVPLRAADPAPHEWVIAAGYEYGLAIIDTSTDIVYAPVLSGELGSEGGGRFDVAVTPDGQTALISNFGDSTVYFVDVSNPISPSVIASVTLGIFAEDIAISPDGQYALVTDGGFSSYIVKIDIPSRTAVYTAELLIDPALGGGADYANAVEIAPNGTVLCDDYFQGHLVTLYPDATGQLTVTGRYSYFLTVDGQLTPTVGGAGLGFAPPLEAASETGVAEASGNEVHPADIPDHFVRPVNVSVAPDGQTVLMGDVSAYNYDLVYTEAHPVYLYAVTVHRIIAPGVVTFTGVITGLSRAAQSIAFSADGAKAYLAGNGGYAADSDNYRRLIVLNITGPGQVSLALDNAVDYPPPTGSQLFGVDTIAVSNGKAYVGSQTVSGADAALRVVNLSDYSVKRLDLPEIPVGVAVIPVQRVYLPIVVNGAP